MTAPLCRCLATSPNQWNPAQPSFVQAHPRWVREPSRLRGACVVLPRETLTDAEALLRAGAACVYLGESALHQADAVAALVQRYGGKRVGIYAPVQRQAVSWSFETESNADFSVVTPSLCEPTWEVLRADGSASGVRALAWLQACLARGVTSVLLRADLADDTDLNLCAHATEALGPALWVGPLTQDLPNLPDWVAYGHVTQLALPTALYAQRHALLAPPGAADVRAAAPV